MIIFYFLVFSAACATVIAFRDRQNSALAAYRVLPTLSLFPYLLHVLWTWNFVSSFGPPEHAPNGIFAGLVAFALFSIGLIAILLALAVALARRIPLIVALTPMVAGFFYWQVAPKLLYWQSPGGFVYLDNVPLIWLFLSSVFSTILMGLCGWFVFVRPSLPAR